MRGYFLLALLLASLLGACGKPKPPNHFEAADMAFDYPHEWRVEFDQQEGAIHVVTLDSEAEMMVSVSVFPAGMISLDGYVEVQQQTFREGAAATAFRQISREAVTLAGQPGVEIRYAVGESAADLQRSQFVGFEQGEMVAFVFVNAPEMGFEKIEPGFQQLLESFTLSVAQPAG